MGSYLRSIEGQAHRWRHERPFWFFNIQKSRFHDVVRPFRNRSQKMSKRGMNIHDTLGYRLVGHVLGVICDLLLNGNMESICKIENLCLFFLRFKLLHVGYYTLRVKSHLVNRNSAVPYHLLEGDRWVRNVKGFSKISKPTERDEICHSQFG